MRKISFSFWSYKIPLLLFAVVSHPVRDNINLIGSGSSVASQVGFYPVDLFWEAKTDRCHFVFFSPALLPLHLHRFYDFDLTSKFNTVQKRGSFISRNLNTKQDNTETLTRHVWQGTDGPGGFRTPDSQRVTFLAVLICRFFH